MIELLELKFSRRWQTNKIESDWSNSPRHSSSRQFRSPSLDTKSQKFMPEKNKEIAISDLVGAVKFKNNNFSIISFHQFMTEEIW